MGSKKFYFSPHQTRHWRDLLEQQRKIVLATEDTLRRHALTELSASETGEISSSRLHPADLATNTQEIETLQTISEKNIHAVHEIELALDRLNDGSFGLCQSCNEPISVRRLEILPQARFCLDCEDEKEASDKQTSDFDKTSFSDLSEVFGHYTVADVMQENPITVNANESLEVAALLLSDNHIRHLPVTNAQGDIQGVISDRDLLGAVMRFRPGRLQDKIENTLSKKFVKNVMTKTPETVTPETSLVEASHLLLENKIGCLPVVEGNHLVGMITESDFVRLAGQ